MSSIATCALFLVSALASFPATGQVAPMATRPPTDPIVIAHRGASGERPEHTLAAYDRAIDQGADFIEPDLVPTKDDVLVARHENEIGGTTDVAKHPEFASRRTAKTIDGNVVTGWFTEDFTLAELKAEIIALAKRRSAASGRTIGIYPETKHPTYFAGIGHPTEARLVAALRAAGWDRPDAPVFIQSFEVKNLQRLHAITRIRLIQLMDGQGGPADGAVASYAAMATPAGLKAVAAYAWGIGPNKAMLWAGGGQRSALVADAHAAGLGVHPWTYRAENMFLPPAFRRGDEAKGHGDVAAEIRSALDQKIDGFFTDFPAIGVAARNAAQE